jgi:phage terminase large subunit-like protein
MPTKINPANNQIHFMMDRLHPSQQEAVDQMKRFNVFRCGRRWGKSKLLMWLMLSEILKGKSLLKGKIVPRTIAYIAPKTTDQTYKDTWKELYDRTAMLQSDKPNKSERTFNFITGAYVRFFSAEAINRVRGGSWDYIFVDEAAQINNLEGAWQEVLSPTLVDRMGKIFISSTPKGMNGFYALAQREHYQRDWKSFHFTSYQNPMIDSAEIERLKEELTQEQYRQEIMAEFVDNAGVVFRGLDTVLRRPSHTVPNKTYRYVMGVDWGRDHDFTVVTIMCVNTNEMVVMDMFNKVGWDVQRSRIQRHQEDWECEKIIVELNSIGSVNAEALQNLGLPIVGFNTTATSKKYIIDSLALAIERNEISMLNYPEIKSQFLAFTTERLPSGGYRYTAPEGQHDDIVMSTAICYHGLTSVMPETW